MLFRKAERNVGKLNKAEILTRSVEKFRVNQHRLDLMSFLEADTILLIEDLADVGVRLLCTEIQ